MTGLVDSGTSALQTELDRLIETLTPAVEGLLRHIAPDEQVITSLEGSDTVIEVPLRFPDGIGQGRVVADLFRYHDTVRLDLHIDHNRFFARPNGLPSDRRCFMNDYKASLALRGGATELPDEFETRVLAGVRAAADAVQRYNRQHPEAWNEIRVAEGPTFALPDKVR